MAKMRRTGAFLIFFYFLALPATPNGQILAGMRSSNVAQGFSSKNLGVESAFVVCITC
jgi:hypothetical protein